MDPISGDWGFDGAKGAIQTQYKAHSEIPKVGFLLHNISILMA